MTAAMCLIRVPVLLSAVILCTGSSTPSGAGQGTEAPASTARLTTPDRFTAVQATSNTPQPQTTTTTTTTPPQKTTVAVTPAATSTQTSDRTEGADHSTLSTKTTEQTPEDTVSQDATLSAASVSTKVTVADTTTNSPDSAHSADWGKSDLEENPGLVAVICIFCVIFVLVIVVAAIKCMQSPRSNFERLEDVPLGKVTEDSPFAQYSK